MSIFLAPAFVLILALGFSARLVYLKGQGKDQHRHAAALLGFVWIWFGLSFFLACIQFKG